MPSTITFPEHQPQLKRWVWFQNHQDIFGHCIFWQIPPDLYIFHQISADLSRSWQILVDLDGSWQILADMCRSIKIFINLHRYWLIVIFLLISWLLNLSQAAALHHRLQSSSTWSEGWQHQGWFLDLIAVAVTHNYYIETLIFMLDLV